MKQVDSEVKECIWNKKQMVATQLQPRSGYYFAFFPESYGLLLLSSCRRLSGYTGSHLFIKWATGPRAPWLTTTPCYLQLSTTPNSNFCSVSACSFCRSKLPFTYSFVLKFSQSFFFFSFLFFSLLAVLWHMEFMDQGSDLTTVKAIQDPLIYCARPGIEAGSWHSTDSTVPATAGTPLKVFNTNRLKGKKRREGDKTRVWPRGWRCIKSILRRLRETGDPVRSVPPYCHWNHSQTLCQ